MPDFRFKYGRKPKKTDPRTLQFAKYLTPALPVAPASVSWQHGLSSFGMMLNDTLGDCTIAAVGHAVQVWLANNNQVASVPDSTILEYYEKWDGYVLNDPSTDQGGVCLDVLSDWQKQGFANYPLKAFADVNSRDRQQVKQAIYLFGGVYIGLNVPQFVEDNEDPSVIWDNQTTNREVVGGHCVFCLSGETSISLLDGRDVTILEAQKEFGSDSFWVYSYDYKLNKLVAGRAHSIRKTKEQAKVYKVTLDSGESFRCTDDHKFQTKKGEWKFPEIGESLVGLYRMIADGYERVRVSRWPQYQATHKVIGESIIKPEIERYRAGIDYGGWVVHHKWNDAIKGFSSLDNRPEMIEWMRWLDHQHYHKQSADQRETSRCNMLKLWADPQWRKTALARTEQNRRSGREKMIAEGRCGFQALGTDRMRAIGSANGKKSWPGLVTPEARAKKEATIRWLLENDENFLAKKQKVALENLKKAVGLPLTPAQSSARRMNAIKLAYKRFNSDKFPTFEAYLAHREQMGATSPNHKVSSIEFVGYEDVYDLTVDEHHNFALSCGIFAHNCIGYESNLIHFISWGQVYTMTVAFWKNFVTESYALLSPSWLATSGAPNGFDLAQLEADLAQIK